jgi:hypothetical protein
LGNLSIFLGVNHGRVIRPVIFSGFSLSFSFRHFFQFLVLVFFLPFLSGASPRLLALSLIKGNPHVHAYRGAGYKRSQKHTFYMQ